MYHHPVLLNEVIAHLNIKRNGLYIDATFGEGGYSLEIIKKGGRVLAIDLDKNQIESLKSKVEGPELILVQGNFRDIEAIAKKHDFFPVDGIVFDLGLSMKQIRESGRGFSYKNENEPLDMRLDVNKEKTAAYYLNTLSEQELYELFAKNAEELNSWPIARAIVFARKVSKIRTVGDLTRVIERAIGRKDNAVLARIFQSLRIEVNHEFENLKRGLKGAKRILKKEGQILVLSYHSLEDRIIKQFGAEKPIKAKSSLRFERSAKLRIIR